MTDFNWLHISDLHLGMKGLRDSWPNVEHDFFNDLKYVMKQTGPLDLILFTGDLVQGGRRQEFDEIDKLMNKLLRFVANGDRAPILLTIPGNHDLIWPKDQADPSLLALTNSWQRKEVQDAFWNKKKHRLRLFIEKCFKNYSAWWNNNPLNPGSRAGILPGDFSKTIEKDGIALGIIGLNTSFLQLTPGNLVGKLAIHSRQFNEVCDGHGPDWIGKHDACLLLTHHPPHWLREEGQKELESEIHYPPERFALHLFGHMHEPKQEYVARGGAAARRRFQGCSLFGLESWGEKNEQRIHGYSLGQLRFAKGKAELRIWPRRAMERQGRGRNIDRDQSFDLPRGKDHTEPTPVARNGGQLARAKRIGSIGAKAVKAVPSRPKDKVFAKLPIPDLEGPTGLAIDGGTLYVADHSQGVVRGINLSKEQEIGRFGGLNRPHHLAAMSGSLLVTDTYNDRVICLNSELKEVWSTTSLDGHEFLRPHGVAANTPGEFYLADSNHNQLLRVENKTVKTVIWQDDAAGEAASAVMFHNPCGVAVDEDHVYVADTFNHRVVILSRDLQYVHRFGRIGSGFGEFSYPVGVAVWRQWLVVADEYNQRLQLWRLTKEEETTSATCLAEAFCANVLRSPFGVAFNTFGDLFIADRRAGAVWKVDFEQAVKAIPA